MKKRARVLYVLHNHPAFRVGGAEVYALELYEAMKESSDFEPILLARAETTIRGGARLGTASREDPSQYVLYTEKAGFDHLLGTARRKDVRTHFRRFLASARPDVVHFQHTLFLGYDTIPTVRRTLPSAPIVYTLHDYLPICHRNGQMVRTGSEELCTEASPSRCHGCFPEISPASFARRERFVKKHLGLVDLFLAPSAFLRQRYVEWGLPATRIQVEDYGRRPQEPLAETPVARTRTRLGFFGQITPFKGVDVLLEAMKMLAEQGVPVHLWLHGANLELAGHAYRRRVEALLAVVKEVVTMMGPYDRSQLPALMEAVDWVVVPSIWWENSPLVIQEAFMHGRPVLCSDIGGMAEKVRHGVDGLHFRAGDPVDLARTIRTAVQSSARWNRLREGTPFPHAMSDHLIFLEDTYRSLLEATSVQRKEERTVLAGA